MSKLFSHLETNHGTIRYGNKTSDGQFGIRSDRGLDFIPLKKVDDLEVIFNRESHSENIEMFWISLNASPKEAKKYQYTLTLMNKDGTKILASKSSECLSIAMSHDYVRSKATALLLPRDDMKKADPTDKWLQWKVKVLIEKK